MTDPNTATEIQTLLRSAQQGDQHAAESLLPLLYKELKDEARRRMNQEKPGQTLQPTALVHEAYMRIVGKDDPGWDSGRHFYAAAAEAMRRILIERARGKGRLKRGGDFDRVEFDDFAAELETQSVDVLDLHAAIDRLQVGHARMAKLAVLRCFGGLTIEDAALAMDVSLSTVERDWRFTKAFLRQELGA